MTLFARPQSGFYVRSISKSLPEPSITLPDSIPTDVSLSELAARILSLPSDHNIVPYGAVNPAPELLPIRKLNRILASVSTRANSVANAYSPSSGLEELRRQIARRLFESGVSSATRAAKSRVDLVTLKDLLGHSRLDMVLRYAHPSEKHRFDAIRKIEEM